MIKVIQPLTNFDQNKKKYCLEFEFYSACSVKVIVFIIEEGKKKTYAVLRSTGRHIPTNKGALATDGVIGRMITLAISRTIRELIGVVILTVDSPDTYEVVTLM